MDSMKLLNLLEKSAKNLSKAWYVIHACQAREFQIDDLTSYLDTYQELQQIFALQYFTSLDLFT